MLPVLRRHGEYQYQYTKHEGNIWGGGEKRWSERGDSSGGSKVVREQTEEEEEEEEEEEREKVIKNYKYCFRTHLSSSRIAITISLT